ncbi:hypothetical protein EIP91_003736 [Steccherinum ochraceum]|uniref:Uncharacterized protein n=1 Tax=Steccherinum ochraceum TaxID=92696 RepID=A0A4R0RST8_9APHY|nr:hypothetical protein EIP91_003736 [Steccherinum ochraceum]
MSSDLNPVQLFEVSDPVQMPATRDTARMRLNRFNQHLNSVSSAVINRLSGRRRLRWTVYAKPVAIDEPAPPPPPPAMPQPIVQPAPPQHNDSGNGLTRQHAVRNIEPYLDEHIPLSELASVASSHSARSNASLSPAPRLEYPSPAASSPHATPPPDAPIASSSAGGSSSRDQGFSGPTFEQQVEALAKVEAIEPRHLSFEEEDEDEQAASRSSHGSASDRDALAAPAETRPRDRAPSPAPVASGSSSRLSASETEDAVVKKEEPTETDLSSSPRLPSENLPPPTNTPETSSEVKKGKKRARDEDTAPVTPLSLPRSKVARVSAPTPTQPTKARRRAIPAPSTGRYNTRAHARITSSETGPSTSANVDTEPTTPGPRQQRMPANITPRTPMLASGSALPPVPSAPRKSMSLQQMLNSEGESELSALPTKKRSRDDEDEEEDVFGRSPKKAKE